MCNTYSNKNLRQCTYLLINLHTLSPESNANKLYRSTLRLSHTVLAVIVVVVIVVCVPRVAFETNHSQFLFRVLCHHNCSMQTFIVLRTRGSVNESMHCNWIIYLFSLSMCVCVCERDMWDVH